MITDGNPVCFIFFLIHLGITVFFHVKIVKAKTVPIAILIGVGNFMSIFVYLFLISISSEILKNWNIELSFGHAYLDLLLLFLIIFLIAGANVIVALLRRNNK